MLHKISWIYGTDSRPVEWKPIPGSLVPFLAELNVGWCFRQIWIWILAWEASHCLIFYSNPRWLLSVFCYIEYSWLCFTTSLFLLWLKCSIYVSDIHTTWGSNDFSGCKPIYSLNRTRRFTDHSLWGKAQTKGGNYWVHYKHQSHWSLSIMSLGIRSWKVCLLLFGGFR